MNEQQRKQRMEAIQKAQDARGISEKELAEKAGISRTTLWAIKNGSVKRPRPATMEAIARILALGVEQAEELRQIEERAWEQVVRTVDVGRSRVERGLETPGLALYSVALALTVGGPYEFVGDSDYGFGIQPVSADEERGSKE